MTQLIQIPEWELLTRACLAKERDEIEKNALLWAETVNPNDINYKSMRLIPYFVDYLKKNNILIPHEKRLNVIYKYWWLKSNWILHELNRITDLFSDNDIPLLVIKGAALNQIYEKPIHRTMVDIDIVVPKKDVIKAFKLLSENGFRGKEKHVKFYKYFPKISETYMHAFFLIDKKSGLEIDLHWKLGNNLSEEILNYCWENAINDTNNKKRKLPPRYLLFVMNCINGFMSQEHHGNWLLDCKLLINSFSKKEIDDLKNFLSRFDMSIWPHIKYYLAQFDIQYEPLDIDFKPIKNLIPKQYSVRKQKSLKKRLFISYQNYKLDIRKRQLVNNKPSLKYFSIKYILWKFTMLVFFSNDDEKKEIKEWKEYTNI